MNAATLALIVLVIFSLAYRFYGKYLSLKVFELDQEKGQTPSYKYQDNIDYVPTNKNVLIGHHFSSIAGAAPIVGPAVAAIWGWLPAMLWIVCGVIFMGACHDFGALVLSMRHKGKSLAEVAQLYLGKKAKLMFLTVIFFLVWIVIAVFTLVIAGLFIKFPGSVIPVNFEIIIALFMGYFINKKKMSLTLPSIAAQLGLMIMIVIGSAYPISLSTYFGIHDKMIWIVFLMIYSFIASTAPVWLLLQPRDYINSHQLVVGLGLMIIGLFIVRPEIVAPALNLHPQGAPSWFPFLFITIACGAISGFHGLVSGGTTSKQVKKWKDAKPIAYGSMLLESLLAVLATLAVTTGFSSSEGWHKHYASWDQANGLSQKISAFVLGAGKFVAGVGIPEDISHTVIAVLIISFAATSLDTACRIQRYIIAEFGEAFHKPALKNRFLGSGIAVGSAFILMISGQGGKGGLSLWPLFGATNQMLASLTLILISVYLIKNKKRYLSFLIPALFLFLITTVGLLINIRLFFMAQQYFLTALAMTLLAAQAWVSLTGYLAIKDSMKQT